MRRHLLAAMMCATTTGALAADAAMDAFFGRIDTALAPRPDVIHPRPLKADAGPGAVTAVPLYLHVKPGEDQHWAAHCKAYGACSVPVLFVKETWYRNVYLPIIGAADGRERYYVDHVRMDRDASRDQRHRHTD